MFKKCQSVLLKAQNDVFGHVLSTAQRYSVYCQKGLNSLKKKGIRFTKIVDI